MYKHIVLDLDNTLVRSGDLILNALSAMLSVDMGLRLTDELRAEIVSLPTDDALRFLGYTDLEAGERRWNDFIDQDETGFVLYDGAAELLEELRDLGVSLGIVTSRFDRELWDKAILPYKSFFSVIVTRDDVAKPKPDAEPLLVYMERAGIAAKDVLFVGDSAHDANCAKAAGVDFAHALWGAVVENDIEATYRPKTPRDLLVLLAGSMLLSE